MSVDKFNSEGYYDPTAYEAMSIIEKEKRALRAFRPTSIPKLWMPPGSFSVRQTRKLNCIPAR